MHGQHHGRARWLHAEVLEAHGERGRTAELIAGARVTVAFQVTSLSTPWIERFPVRSNCQVPDVGSGRGSPLTFVAAKVAVGKRRVSSVFALTKLSRRLSSLLSVLRSTTKVEPGRTPPSAPSRMMPEMLAVLRTASCGAGTMASCSRTRTLTLDRSPTTVNAPAPESAVGLRCALAIASGA